MSSLSNEVCRAENDHVQCVDSVPDVLDTFVDANIRRDVVAGSGVGSGLAAHGSSFSAARASVTISR
jgi:hypothetical protein